MTDKEMKRLNRHELLELLLVQTQEAERLRKELQEVKQQLEDRRLKMAEAGNLAEAALAVNGVMEAAQAAAQQYLDNMAAMEAETRRKCELMLNMASQQARKLRESAAHNEG